MCASRRQRRGDKRGSHAANPAVAKLNDAFKRGKSRKLPANVRSHESISAAEQAFQRSTTLLNSATGNSDLEAAAAELGFAYTVARMLRDRDIEYNALARLGMAHDRYVSTDSDLSKDEAARYLVQASDGYIGMGNYRAAAIDRTNAANALLEKAHPTTEDFELAKGYLDFSLNYKDENSVDWAYSKFTLGMYYKNVPSETLAQRISNLSQARELIQEALEIFQANREGVSVSSGAELGNVQVKLFGARQQDRFGRAVMAHIDEIPDILRGMAENGPDSFAGVMVSNPAALGLDETPSWLQAELNRQPDQSEFRELTETRDLIHQSLVDMPASDWTAIQAARWWEARLNWILEETETTYRALVKAVGELEEDVDPERFLRNALFASNASHQVNQKPPLELLRAIPQAFISIVQSRETSRIEAFLRSRPNEIRFVACSLCDHGQWDAAIEVLENSRIILYADLITGTTPSEFIQGAPPVSPSWVYVAHSPNATYVIVKSEEEPATGLIVNELSGARLIELTHSFAYGSLGLVTAQTPGVGGSLAPAVDLALRGIEPTVKAILSLVSTDRGICLVLCGQYANLPIAAALVDSEKCNFPYVTVVPSRARTLEMRSELELIDAVRFTALTAERAPGAAVLDYPEDEAEALYQLLTRTGVQGRTVANATADDLVKAVKQSNLLHFSGHSSADPVDPSQSTIYLEDGGYEVSRILTELNSRSLIFATLSSCQSAQASTYSLADEFLGVQSALLYSGCRFVIGTLWPVVDFAACVFMSRLYLEISTHRLLNIDTLYVSLRRTQSWVKIATLDNILEFRATQEFDWELPASIRSQPGSIVPLGHPKHWAAFYLSSRTV